MKPKYEKGEAVAVVLTISGKPCILFKGFVTNSIRKIQDRAYLLYSLIDEDGNYYLAYENEIVLLEDAPEEVFMTKEEVLKEKIGYYSEYQGR